MRDEREVTLGGNRWVYMMEAPRLVAESFRRLLDQDDIPSVLRTPFQWVAFTPVIEIETGGYMGSVGLYVLKVHEQAARRILGILGEYDE